MEPEPERIDLSALDPRRDTARWEQGVARVAQRGRELRRLRRAVVRRGTVAVALAAAAALALWLFVPHDVVTRSPHVDVLDWATHTPTADEVLQLGAGHAH